MKYLSNTEKMTKKLYQKIYADTHKSDCFDVFFGVDLKKEETKEIIPTQGKNSFMELESDDSIFKDFGIARDSIVEEIGEERTYNVAQDFRILLDVLERNLTVEERVRPKQITFEKIEQKEIFEKVYMLNKVEHWQKIDQFMHSYFPMKWELFCTENNHQNLTTAKGQNEKDLPMWKGIMAKQVAQYMYDKRWNDTFALVGSFGLREYYKLPLIVNKIEVFAMKKDLESNLNTYCFLNGLEAKITMYDNSSKYALFELDYDVQNQELLLTEVYPYEESDDYTLENKIFSNYKLHREIKNDIPYLSFNSQCLLFQCLLDNKINALERLYQLCMLAHTKEEYLSQIRQYIVSKGLEFFYTIISKEENKMLDKVKIIKDLLAIWDNQKNDSPLNYDNDYTQNEEEEEVSQYEEDYYEEEEDYEDIFENDLASMELLARRAKAKESELTEEKIKSNEEYYKKLTAFLENLET